jgi:hypothetical protein
MDLKRAQIIAKQVGARIRPVGTDFEITLGVPGSENMLFTMGSPKWAAHTAVIETAKAAKALMDRAKQIYVDEDLLL